jgi:transcriptional regulator with XRE-family HTH domain
MAGREVCRMADSFGARLRQRREERQIALPTIAEQTKIKQSLLEGLERDDVSRWPGGIFRRAFLRAYAHAIGLDADVVVREFLELHPDPEEEVEAALGFGPIPGDAVATNSTPPTRIRNIVNSVFAHFLRPEAGSNNRTSQAAPQEIVDGTPVIDRLPMRLEALAPPKPDLAAAARLCTELGCANVIDEAEPLLARAAKLLDATGLIVWVWDARDAHLKPSLAHGYARQVLAQLPSVTSDADNATAAAFRTGQACRVRGGELTNGALVVPLMTSTGCNGVLALELQRRQEQSESVLALATIVAAQFARLIESTRPAAADGRRLA